MRPWITEHNLPTFSVKFNWWVRYPQFAILDFGEPLEFPSFSFAKYETDTSCKLRTCLVLKLFLVQAQESSSQFQLVTRLLLPKLVQT